MKLNQIHIRDPFILLDNEKYYLYGSRGDESWGKCTGLDVYVSDDLENWSSAHECFTPPDDFWSDMQFWAPEVHKYKEKYYMFVSFRSETRERGTQILVSDYPMGPFKVHSDGPVTPLEWRCLDGTLYIDKKESPYIVFCHEYAQIKDGTICALALTDDLKESIGEPIELFKASSCSKITGLNGEGNYVTDGPFMYRAKSGKLIMLWSSYSYGEYCVIIAYSDNGEIDGNWIHEQEFLFENDGGHCMLFNTKDNELKITMHTPNKNPNERPVIYDIKEVDDSLKLV